MYICNEVSTASVYSAASDMVDVDEQWLIKREVTRLPNSRNTELSWSVDHRKTKHACYCIESLLSLHRWQHHLGICGHTHNWTQVDQFLEIALLMTKLFTHPHRVKLACYTGTHACMNYDTIMQGFWMNLGLVFTCESDAYGSNCISKWTTETFFAKLSWETNSHLDCIVLK